MAFSQSTSWACGGCAPDLPLLAHTLRRRTGWVHGGTWLAERWHLVFICAHYTTANLPIQIALSLSTHHTWQPALQKAESQAPVGHFSTASHVKSPAKICPITSWEMEVISNTPQLACSGIDTADSTAVSTHLEEWSVALLLNWLDEKYRLVATVEAAGWWWLLLWLLRLFSSLCVSHRNRRCAALCIGVKNITASPSPLPQRGFRECNIPPKLCRGTIGPPSECVTSLWDHLLFLRVL